jgi:hypothetical protein
MGGVAYVMFYVGERPLELIICLLDVFKKEFVDFDIMMFEEIERPYEFIFCILRIEKSDLVEVA